MDSVTIAYPALPSSSHITLPSGDCYPGEHVLFADAMLMTLPAFGAHSVLAVPL